MANALSRCSLFAHTYSNFSEFSGRKVQVNSIDPHQGLNCQPFISWWQFANVHVRPLSSNFDRDDDNNLSVRKFRYFTLKYLSDNVGLSQDSLLRRETFSFSTIRQRKRVMKPIVSLAIKSYGVKNKFSIYTVHFLVVLL